MQRVACPRVSSQGGMVEPNRLTCHRVLLRHPVDPALAPPYASQATLGSGPCLLSVANRLPLTVDVRWTPGLAPVGGSPVPPAQRAGFIRATSRSTCAFRRRARTPRRSPFVALRGAATRHEGLARDCAKSAARVTRYISSSGSNTTHRCARASRGAARLPSRAAVRPSTRERAHHSLGRSPRNRTARASSRHERRGGSRARRVDRSSIPTYK
jgi:hypothetical protein